MSGVRQVSEARLDEIEEALRRKIETLSGFADIESQARKLELTFKYYDTDQTGAIDFSEFNAAMVRLNFVGVQRELEALFDRFDSDLSGAINYAEFALGLFGMGGKRMPDPVSRSVIERVKARIIERGGATGLRGITRLLRRMDKNGSLTLERDELVDGLLDYGIDDLDESEGGDVDKLMKYFDRDGSGRISIEEFIRGLKGTMAKRRIMIVKEAFSRLDRTGDGRVLLDDFTTAYDASHHPEVVSGRMSEEEAVQELMEVYERGNSDGEVTWAEFLDYYKDLSAGIDSDDYFELMVRNAWHISGGTGWAENSTCRRVLVTHGDGSQEVVEVEDDLGIGADDMRAIRFRLEEQGVEDIAEISLAN